jgi:hypothetical protein
MNCKAGLLNRLIHGRLPAILHNCLHVIILNSHSTVNQRCFCQPHAQLCQSIADVFHKLSPIIQWLNCRVDCTVHNHLTLISCLMTVHSVDCSWFLSSQSSLYITSINVKQLTITSKRLISSLVIESQRAV